MEDKKEQGYNIICGRNPVLEAVRSGREIDRLLVALIIKALRYFLPNRNIAPLKIF